MSVTLPVAAVAAALTVSGEAAEAPSVGEQMLMADVPLGGVAHVPNGGGGGGVVPAVTVTFTVLFATTFSESMACTVTRRLPAGISKFMSRVLPSFSYFFTPST